MSSYSPSPRLTALYRFKVAVIWRNSLFASGAFGSSKPAGTAQSRDEFLLPRVREDRLYEWRNADDRRLGKIFGIRQRVLRLRLTACPWRRLCAAPSRRSPFLSLRDLYACSQIQWRPRWEHGCPAAFLTRALRIICSFFHGHSGSDTTACGRALLPRRRGRRTSWRGLWRGITDRNCICCSRGAPKLHFLSVATPMERRRFF